MAAKGFLCLVFTIYCLAISGAANYDNQLIRSSGGAWEAVELWCVASNNAENMSVQVALNWVCGEGGADCGPIQAGGPCYHANDIRLTASYAFNDYFLKHGLINNDSCNFHNSAALTSINPSYGSCKFPSRSIVSGSSTKMGLSPVRVLFSVHLLLAFIFH